MRREQPAMRQIRKVITGLFEHGCSPNWVNLTEPGQITSLPNYAWRKDRYWLPRRETVLSAAPGVHPLLESCVQSPMFRGAVWNGVVGSGASAYLSEHRIGGCGVVPASAMIEMMQYAARDWLEISNFGGEERHALSDVAIHDALVLPQGRERRVQVCIHEYR